MDGGVERLRSQLHQWTAVFSPQAFIRTVTGDQQAKVTKGAITSTCRHVDALMQQYQRLIQTKQATFKPADIQELQTLKRSLEKVKAEGDPATAPELDETIRLVSRTIKSVPTEYHSVEQGVVEDAMRDDEAILPRDVMSIVNDYLAPPPQSQTIIIFLTTIGPDSEISDEDILKTRADLRKTIPGGPHILEPLSRAKAKASGMRVDESTLSEALSELARMASPSPGYTMHNLKLQRKIERDFDQIIQDIYAVPLRGTLLETSNQLNAFENFMQRNTQIVLNADAGTALNVLHNESEGMFLLFHRTTPFPPGWVQPPPNLSDLSISGERLARLREAVALVANKTPDMQTHQSLGDRALQAIDKYDIVQTESQARLRAFKAACGGDEGPLVQIYRNISPNPNNINAGDIG